MRRSGWKQFKLVFLLLSLRPVDDSTLDKFYASMLIEFDVLIVSYLKRLEGR